MSDYLSIDAEAVQLLVLSTGDDPGITLQLGVPGPAGKDTSASITNGPGVSIASANGILTITNADRGSEAVTAHVAAKYQHPEYAKGAFETGVAVAAGSLWDLPNDMAALELSDGGVYIDPIYVSPLRNAIGAVSATDSRLSDARTPTAHDQKMSTISDMTPTGRLLGGAADAAAARGAIGAAPTATPVFTGLVTARQTGGTAGTHELRLSHDGVRALLESLFGLLELSTSSSTGTFRFSRRDIPSRFLDIITDDSAAVAFIQSQATSIMGFRFLNPVQLDQRPLWFSNGSRANHVGLDRAGSFAVMSVIGSTPTVGGTFRSIPLTPPQITADQHNYPLGVSHSYRWSSDAPRAVTGLSISQVDGQWGRIFNVGSHNLTLVHQSVLSTAANRFLCVTSADLVLAPNDAAGFEYDAAISRFRLWRL